MNNKQKSQKAMKKHLKNKARKARSKEQMQFHYLVAMGKAWRELNEKAGEPKE